jgi:hypothetical protein
MFRLDVRDSATTLTGESRVATVGLDVQQQKLKVAAISGDDIVFPPSYACPFGLGLFGATV